MLVSGRVPDNNREPEPALRDNLVGKIPQKDTAFPPCKLSYLLYYAFKTELQYKWVRVNLKSAIFLRGKLCFVTVAFMFHAVGNRHFPNYTHPPTHA